jgi:DNA-binding CsgD family transcriptional regulator
LGEDRDREAASGGEVRRYVVADLIDGAVARRGLRREEVMRGTGLERQCGAARIGWTQFTILLDNLVAALGSPQGLEELAGELVPESRVLRLLGRLVLTPRQLYLHASERIGRNTFTIVGGRAEELADGRIHVTGCIPPPHRESLPFSHFSLGVFRAMPLLLDHPPALIAADLAPRRAVYVITPPEPRTLAAQAASMLALPLEQLFGALRGEAATAGDLLEAIEMAYDDSSALAEARSLGQRLASLRDLDALADELVALMRERFCCRRVALWVVGTGRAAVVRAVSDDGASAAVVSTRPLTLAGHEIGRLEVDIPTLAAGAPTPFFDALLPWLALGLESCLRKDAAREDVGRAAARAAESWQLTRRQGEVLALLLRGLSNREIGDALGASAKTIEVHVGRLLRKAGAASRAALIATLWASSPGQRRV